MEWDVSLDMHKKDGKNVHLINSKDSGSTHSSQRRKKNQQIMAAEVFYWRGFDRRYARRDQR